MRWFLRGPTILASTLRGGRSERTIDEYTQAVKAKAIAEAARIRNETCGQSRKRHQGEDRPAAAPDVRRNRRAGGAGTVCQDPARTGRSKQRELEKCARIETCAETCARSCSPRFR